MIPVPVIATPDRRRLLLAGSAMLAGLLLPPAVRASAAPQRARLTERDRADLARVADYFNRFRTLQSRFLQIAPDGGATEGKLFISKPGRFRFEYDPPVPMLIVSDGAYIIIEDRELKTVERVPLGATPLDLMMRETVTFDDSMGIAGIERGAAILRVTLFAPDRPKEGTLTMVFGDQPLEFAGWTVSDAQGKVTAVTLSRLDFNPQLNTRLFTYGDRPASERELQRRR